LKVENLEELMEIYEALKKNKNPPLPRTGRRTHTTTPGTITALGIGPDDDEKIDKITKHLKLL